MKILGISGGMRNGSNDGMCIEALMGAKEMGAEVEFIQLQNLHIESKPLHSFVVRPVRTGFYAVRR